MEYLTNGLNVGAFTNINIAIFRMFTCYILDIVNWFVMNGIETALDSNILQLSLVSTTFRPHSIPYFKLGQDWRTSNYISY